MQYYERLRQVREDRDITQTQAAEVIHSSQNQMYRYENGVNEMTVGKLRELCLLYGVSADYILDLPKDLDWPR